MATTKVLLLGGHGKIALYLTPLLLAKSWNVTSVVRNPDHESEILKLGENKPGKVEVLIDSLDDVTSVDRAENVLNKVNPDIVVWSAGAGGKGGAARTKAIDEVAAKHYISASIARPSVKKFLIVSYIASRKGRPSWWNDDDWKSAEQVNTKILPAYFAAKVEADEHLVAVAKKRNDKDPSFQAINLRPGTLKDNPSTGKVTLGKTSARGDVNRETVAEVAAALLERDDTRGWYDLLEGDEPIDDAVARLVKEKWDGIEGEDLDRIYARI
jgi:nucleoside-diphosphate-sugar epimerase